MLQYIIKLSISLSIVYLFYQLFLRRLTFYTWNRWYLLIYSMVCFVIPFINVFTIIIERPALRESAFINYIPAITQLSPASEGVAVSGATGIDWLRVAVVVLIAGMLLMVVRLLLQYYSLYKMRSKAVLLYDEKVKLYHIDEPVMPFSFGRGIYVNQHQHSEHELKEIIRHEFIHVKQRHSLDILWSELLCILNWYNPFAWLLRHDIRQNLEFVADQQVLQTGLDRKQYQYLLLKVIGVNSFSIATNFNFSSLKRRIAMMNKTKSARVHLIRFLFLLPLLVVVLLAFRNTTREHDRPLKEKQIVTDTLPVAPKTPAGWQDVNTIDITDELIATVRLKNGKIEKYDLRIIKEKEAFEKKYGAVPEPPTPPVPLTPNDKELPEAPEAPERPEMPEAPEKPEAPEMPERAELPEAPEAPKAPEAPEAPEKAPYSINWQDCMNKKGYCITVADNYGECIVIVKDKHSKIVTAVLLTDWNKDKQYENMFGEIPPRQIQLMPKYKTGHPVKAKTLTRMKGTYSWDNEVAVVGKPAEAKIAIASKIAAEPQASDAVKAVPHKVVIGKPMEVKIAEASKKATDPNATIRVNAVPHELIGNGKKKGVKVVTGKPYGAKADAEPAKVIEKPKAAAAEKPVKVVNVTGWPMEKATTDYAGNPVIIADNAKSVNVARPIPSTTAVPANSELKLLKKIKTPMTIKIVKAKPVEEVKEPAKAVKPAEDTKNQ